MQQVWKHIPFPFVSELGAFSFKDACIRHLFLCYTNSLITHSHFCLYFCVDSELLCLSMCHIALRHNVSVSDCKMNTAHILYSNISKDI